MISNLNIDPVKGAEIFELLSLDPVDLNNRSVLRQVKEIAEYFKDKQGYRYEILKILSKNPSNRVDALWNYVELNKERESLIGKLNPSDFAPDIEQQLKEKYLTKDKIAAIKKVTPTASDILSQRHKERQTRDIYENKKNEALGKLDLYGIQHTVTKIEIINNELENY